MSLKDNYRYLTQEIDESFDEVLEWDLKGILFASEMAIEDPEGSINFTGVYFHENECVFTTSDCGFANCSGESCTWSKNILRLPKSGGYRIIPPFCPRCYRKGYINGVLTH